MIIAVSPDSAAWKAAGLDLRMIRRSNKSRQQRVMRHLWRMCVALLLRSRRARLATALIAP